MNLTQSVTFSRRSLLDVVCLMTNGACFGVLENAHAASFFGKTFQLIFNFLADQYGGALLSSPLNIFFE